VKTIYSFIGWQVTCKWSIRESKGGI